MANNLDHLTCNNYHNLYTGEFNQETHVWKQGMENWKKAGEVTELNSLFNSNSQGPPPPPIYHPPPPPVNPPLSQMKIIHQQLKIQKWIKVIFFR